MVKAIVNGTVVAESSDTAFVENNYYFPREAIKLAGDDFFISEKTYTCPYKGNAAYYTAKVDGTVVKDIAWVYPEPTSKFEIKGKYAFDKAQVQIDTSDSGNKL